MKNTICPDAFVSPFAIKDAVVRALAEDFGRAGDVTSVATVQASAQWKTTLLLSR
jgi:nicotinate-nucleotide pyrophosphorylase (carboxylating)